jgi:hypothetical protein
MNFTISEEKKKSLLNILQTYLDQKLEEYKQMEDMGELDYNAGALVSNLDKIELADIKRTEGVWSVDLIFHMNRIFSILDEDLTYDLSSGLTDYIGENNINISQQQEEYDI